MNHEEAEPLSGKKPVRPIGGFTEFVLRANSWPFICLTLAVFLLFIWWSTNPFPCMVGVFYPCFILFGCLPIASLRQIQLNCKKHFERTLGFEKNQFRTQTRFRFWFFPMVAIAWLIIYSQAPLHYAFHFSRHSLDQLADEVLANPNDLDQFGGRWAGLYRITHVEVIGQTVLLYTSGAGFGCYGFARVPSARSDNIFHSPHDFELPDPPVGNTRDFPPRKGARDPIGKKMTGDWFVTYSNFMFYAFVYSK